MLQYRDLLLPNTVNQKEEIPHTAGLNDTAIPHFKIQITEIPLEKKLNTVSPHFPLHAVEEVIEYLGLKHPIILDVYNLCHNYHSNKLSSFNVSVERRAVFTRVDQTNTYLPISTEKFKSGLCSFHLMKK